MIKFHPSIRDKIGSLRKEYGWIQYVSVHSMHACFQHSKGHKHGFGLKRSSANLKYKSHMLAQVLNIKDILQKRRGNKVNIKGRGDY